MIVISTENTIYPNTLVNNTRMCIISDNGSYHNFYASLICKSIKYISTFA